MSLQCIRCKQSLTRKGRGGSNRTDIALDAALGTYTRLRHCVCGESEKTVEMKAADLSELRRKAYLYERSQA